MTHTLPQIPRLIPAAALLLMAWGSASTAYAADILTISPATGVEQVGQPFTVSVSANGLDSSNDLYAYSFDLAFDPTVFQALAANDGTIFDYGGGTGLYFDGLIDNTNGFVAAQGGIDINGAFNGTGGLLGQFTFVALRAVTTSPIAVENVSLSTLTAASNLGPPDIDPGNLPSAELSSADGTAAPEPGTGALAALVVAGCVFVRRRR
jgi:MYXO-CTERM domain-containing protein